MDRHGRENACDSQADQNLNMVYVASRKSPRGGWDFGYFETRQDIPEGWTEHPDQRDITGIMQSMRCSLSEALVTMNAHWRR